MKITLERRRVSHDAFVVLSKTQKRHKREGGSWGREAEL